MTTTAQYDMTSVHCSCKLSDHSLSHLLKSRQTDPWTFVPNLRLPQDLCTSCFLSLECFISRLSHELAPSHQIGLSSNIALQRGESHRELGSRFANLHFSVCKIRVLMSGVTTLHCPVTHISCVLFVWACCQCLPSFPCVWCAAILRSIRIIRFLTCHASKSHLWWSPRNVTSP